MVNAMQAFVVPISKDDPEMDPIQGFEMEYRRTVARIRWLDERIAELEVENLSWGKTKEVDQQSGSGLDFMPGVDTTYEAKANAWYTMQQWEREHLLKMEKIWITAKLDVKRLEIQKQYVLLLDGAITNILTALGHDVSDSDVRQVVRANLAALPVAGG